MCFGIDRRAGERQRHESVSRTCCRVSEKVRSTFALFPRQRFDIGAKSLEKTGGFCISAGANVREDVAQSAFSKAYEIARKNKVISIGIEKSAKVERAFSDIFRNAAVTILRVGDFHRF